VTGRTPRTSRLDELRRAVVGLVVVSGLVVALVVGRGLAGGGTPAAGEGPTSAGPAAIVVTDPPTEPPTDLTTPEPTETPAEEPSAAPSPEPTAEPSPRPTARHTPKPAVTPYAGPPTARPGTTAVPSPEGDIVVKGRLGTSLHGGGLTVAVSYVGPGAPPENVCEAENGWKLATYHVTTSWTGPKLKYPPVVLNADGAGLCWWWTDPTPIVSGLEYTYVIQQVSGEQAISFYYDYPDAATTVVFKFR
jgi:hypothetical protein